MIVRLIVQTFIWFGAMGILLFLAAGTFAWPGAWTYLALMVTLSLTLGIDLARTDRMGSPGAAQSTGRRQDAPNCAPHLAPIRIERAHGRG